MHQPNQLTTPASGTPQGNYSYVSSGLSSLTVAMSRYEDKPDGHSSRPQRSAISSPECNVHELTLSDGDRTDNFTEAWNSQFETLVSHNNPTTSTTTAPTRSSAIGMCHTCLCLPSFSWYSFTDPGGMEAWVGLVGWLHGETVYLPEGSHPSHY